MSEQEDTRLLQVRVPINVGIRWTFEASPAPYLVDEDSGEPLGLAESAAVVSMLDPQREQRQKTFIQHGIELEDAHDFYGSKAFMLRRGHREGYEKDREELAAASESPGTPWHVYLIRGLEQHKIGISTNVERRLRELKNTGGASSLEVVATAQFADRKVAGSVERHLHDRFKNKRRHGEWFDLNDDEVDEVLRVFSNVFPIGLENDDENVTETLAAD